jgi:hypothetical protein
LPQHFRPSSLRRLAVIAGIAGTLGVGAYGLSAAAAQTSTPSTTSPPTTSQAPSAGNQPGSGSSRGPMADNPNCPNMGGQQNGGTSPSSAYAPV